MIGPDAAGKSTLLGLIAGVRIIQQGQVTVFGGNMANQAYPQLANWPDCLHASRTWQKSLSDAQRL